MVEIVEYALAVMASTLLVTGSVVVYDSFESYEGGLQLSAAFTAVSGVAQAALLNGSARSSVAMPAATLGCEGGTLYLGTGSESISQGIPAACDFSVNVSAGSHTLSFRTEAGRLQLAVS